MKLHPWISLFYLFIRASVCLNNGCLLTRLLSFDGYTSSEDPDWELTIPSQNVIACGVYCARDENCLSVSFNELTNICKGYSKDVSHLPGKTHETGSINYVKKIINEPTFRGLTFGANSTTPPGTVLPLNKEIALFGTADAVKSGIFVCPTSGIYKLLVHALPGSPDASISLAVQVNGVTAVAMYGDEFNDAGNALVTHLDKGAEVSVIVKPGPTQGAGNGQPERSIATFTAVLIKEDNSGGTSEHFTVALSDNAVVSPGNFLIYDHVITDDEQLYDTETGIATVKTSGLFIVHLFAVSQAGAGLELDLYHNNNYDCSIGGYTANKKSTADNTVILYLYSGDKLSIRAKFDVLIQGANETGFITTLTASKIANETDTLAVSNNMDCWEGVYGAAYIGNVSVTETGIECQQWAVDTPHPHSYKSHIHFPCDESEDVVENYCRDADQSEEHPWCLTTNTDVERETCSVPLCPQIRRVTAFSVALAQPTEVSSGSRVKYDHMIYCVNCDYSIPVKKFKAVVAGLYEIHFTALSQRNEQINLELWAQAAEGGKRYIVSIVGSRPGEHARGSNSALVYLNINDMLMVESAAGYKNYLYGNRFDIQCTFSGYLLK